MLALVRFISFLAIISLTALPVKAQFPYDFVLNGLYYRILDHTDEQAVAVVPPLGAPVGSTQLYYPADATLPQGEVTIPSQVEYDTERYIVRTLGEGLFAGCTGLTAVSLPATLHSIESRAFKGCSGLTQVHLPDSIKTLGESVFDGCTSLQSVHLPEALKLLPGYSFNHCVRLRTVDFPSALDSIGGYAFFGCTPLQAVSLPKTLRGLAFHAFGGCSALTSVTLPASLRYLGAGAFGSCVGLKTIFVEFSDPERVNAHCGVFLNVPIGNVPDAVRVIVPDGAAEAFRTSRQWRALNPHIMDMTQYANTITALSAPTLGGLRHETSRGALHLYADTPVTICLTDLRGCVIKQTSLAVGTHSISLTKGLYLLRVGTESGTRIYIP